MKIVTRLCVCALLLRAGLGTSCASDPAALLPSRAFTPDVPGDARLLARIVHISDTHAVDTFSPARFTGAQVLVSSAWRAWESHSTQLFDGIIRTANRIHASGERVDFVLHTGDACDNAQSNELGWVLGVMDGRVIDPLTAPDDRPLESRPPAALDPYAAFQAQGLYRFGAHGQYPSIPWYSVFGNHDVYSIGVFPVVEQPDGTRVAPLPLSGRPGFLLPTVLDPIGTQTYGLITPASPGPPPFLTPPTPVERNLTRAYFSKREFVEAMFSTVSGPPGHGFVDPQGPAWYSVSPVPGVRLIGLDTADAPNPQPAYVYSEGAISATQREWLVAELQASRDRGERVIVASHHPSNSLDPRTGSVLGPDEFRALLASWPHVILHLAGHSHRNRVADRGSYLEIETCSTLDLPQEGRVVELWESPADGAITIAYRMFDGINVSLPPLGDDPLLELRKQANRIAREDRHRGLLQREAGTDAPDDGIAPEGLAPDREGAITLGSGTR